MGVVKAQRRVRSRGLGTDVLPLLPFLFFTGFFLLWPVIAVTLKSFKGNVKMREKRKLYEKRL
jgi:ABC-type uncharacterized transport system permease subunit